jgi:molybdopterin molybdotransferase
MAAPIELEDARRAVLERAAPLPAEEVPLRGALGRHLAAAVVAGAPVQGFENSAMDGFAVRAADTAGAAPGSPAVLAICGEARAGHPAGGALAGGEAIAISTGAMLPAGADAVVRAEDARREDGRVLVETAAAPGSNVRRAGEDIEEGATALQRGAHLGPAELAVLAALGRKRVPCHRRPRVAVLSSGDELVPPGEPLGPGAVHDSNSVSLPALATLAGGEVVSVARAPDDPRATEQALEVALEADVAIACGGVSAGEHDHVKAALRRLGTEQVFWRVALKPGGPAWFGSRGGTLAFGLPGNPVSAMVTFTLLARPALAVLGGGSAQPLRTVATLATACEKRRGRAEAVRCRLELTESGWLAHPAPRQGSHVLTSMLQADCLAILPAAADQLPAGARVEVELLDRASMGR